MSDPQAYRVTWFGPPQRPVEGGTVFVRPAADGARLAAAVGEVLAEWRAAGYWPPLRVGQPNPDAPYSLRGEPWSDAQPDSVPE